MKQKVRGHAFRLVGLILGIIGATVSITSIVFAALGLHQARLSIESEVGTGSVFACHFGPDRVQPRQEDPLALPAAGQPTC